MKSFFTKFAKHKFKLVFIMCAIMVIGVIGLCVWDHVDPPLWYHFEAQKNKSVIMEYAEEHFPEARIVEEHYNSAIPFQTSNKFDYIVYDQDGVQFSILANDGRLLHDNYLTSKASQYIKREIIEPFIIPRNITASYEVYFSGKAPVGPVVEYDEGMRIHFNVKSDYQKDTPEKSGWLYDFFIYFQSESNLKDYQVIINYRTNNGVRYKLRFQEDSTFASSEEFYSAFQRIED